MPGRHFGYKYSIQAPIPLHKLPLGMFFYFCSSFILHLFKRFTDAVIRLQLSK